MYGGSSRRLVVSIPSALSDPTPILILILPVAPAIETFGTHRIIFGSFPALPLAELVRARQEDMPLDQPISNEEWYAVLRKVVSELGEDAEAMTEIMGGNGAKVYELH
jgi:predicted TIM-barrel fold metal-dependent hydrolase